MAFADEGFMDGQDSRITLISWNSWKLTRVCRSSSAAEVRAVSEAHAVASSGGPHLKLLELLV